jgi:hypothetical protein
MPPLWGDLEPLVFRKEFLWDKSGIAVGYVGY